MDAQYRRKPIIVDSSLHTAFMAKYIIYAIFGALGTLSGTPTIAAVAGLPVARTVAFCIFVCSVIAAISVKKSIVKVFWKKLEMYSTIGVVSFVSVYFASAVIIAVTGGPRDRISAGMLALGLVVLPVWRIIQIIRELRLVN